MTLIKNFSALKESKSRQTVFCFQENFPQLSWEDIFLNFEDAIEKNTPFKTLDNFGIVLHSNKIPFVDHFLKEYSTLDQSVDCTAHTYISFTKFSKSFGLHKDNADVLYWQAIGSTTWQVEGYGEFLLNPNSLIFVPKKILHNVIPHGARVGISLGLEYN